MVVPVSYTHLHDEVHLNMMLQRFVRYAYASAYAAKVFYDTENVQPVSYTHL